MNGKKTAVKFLKVGVLSGLVALASLTMLIGTSRPVSADSSFSISISTNDFTVGYRACDGGGYRLWTPGCYDRFHVWHDGYFSGPVIYVPERDHAFYGPRVEAYPGYAHAKFYDRRDGWDARDRWHDR